MENIYYNSILYILLTVSLVLFFINERKISVAVKKKKIKFSDFLIEKFNIKNQKSKKIIENTVIWTESIVSFFILISIIQNFYIGNFLVPTGSMIPAIKPNDRLLGDMLSYKFIKPKRGDIIVFQEPLQNKALFTKRLIAYSGETVSIGDNGSLYIDGKKNADVKLKREYSQMELSSLLSKKTWYIPKKGDYIELKNAKFNFEMGEEKLNINEIQEYIGENPTAVKDLMPNASLVVNGVYQTGPILDFMYEKEKFQKLLDGEKIYLEDNYYFVLGDNTRRSLDSRYWGLVRENRIKGKIFFRLWPLRRIGMVK